MKPLKKIPKNAVIGYIMDIIRFDSSAEYSGNVLYLFSIIDQFLRKPKTLNLLPGTHMYAYDSALYEI